MSSPCFSFASISIPVDFLSDPIDLYAVFLSFIPWFLSLSMIVLSFVKSFRHVPYFRAHCFCFLFNWMVCDSLKFVFKQNRPFGTCLHSYGMPSSHSSVSIGFAMLVLLQWRSPSSFPLFSQLVTGEVGTMSPSANAEDRINMNGGGGGHGGSSSFFSFLENGHKTSLALVRIFIIFNLGMIPWSRVHLMDHSLAQVTVGSGFGVLISLMVWGWFSRKHVTHAHHHGKVIA